MGAKGWSYNDVLPYFRRCETFEGSANAAGGESQYRGAHGPLGTQFAKTPDPLYPAWMEAGRSLGYPVNEDYNAAEQEGFGRGQYTIRDGRRSSTARAFLRPAKDREEPDGCYRRSHQSHIDARHPCKGHRIRKGFPDLYGARRT